jgi:2-amino-4-hydroxy-6-hydroxymethyldihydropteridine diphosphokinase
VAEALLGLGGNLGDVRATLEKALRRFADGKEVKLVARSSDYFTPPWGVTDQPPFIPTRGYSSARSCWCRWPKSFPSG